MTEDQIIRRLLWLGCLFAAVLDKSAVSPTAMKANEYYKRLMRETEGG